MFPVETLQCIENENNVYGANLQPLTGVVFWCFGQKETNNPNSELSEPLLLELLRLLLLLQLLLSHAGSPDGWSSKFICLTK